jgi:hypothetical protein
MLQQLMYDRFGVFSNVFSIAQLLKNLGLSFHKAALVSAHLDEDKRQAWRPTTWPQILHLAKARKALLLFGDDVGGPYTWARRGSNPWSRPQASAKLQVFACRFHTGHCFSRRGGRLNSAAYIAFSGAS